MAIQRSEVTVPEAAIDAAVQVVRDECKAAGGMLRLALKPLETPSSNVRAAVRKAIEAAVRAGARSPAADGRRT